MTEIDHAVVDAYLEQLWDRRGTDLLFTFGVPPLLRVDGLLQAAEGAPVLVADVHDAVRFSSWSDSLACPSDDRATMVMRWTPLSGLGHDDWKVGEYEPVEGTAPFQYSTLLTDTLKPAGTGTPEGEYALVPAQFT